MAKIWRVEFGVNTNSIDVEAKTADEAMSKARIEFRDFIKGEPKDYWISKVELLAESDI